MANHGAVQIQRSAGSPTRRPGVTQTNQGASSVDKTIGRNEMRINPLAIVFWAVCAIVGHFGVTGAEIGLLIGFAVSLLGGS